MKTILIAIGIISQYHVGTVIEVDPRSPNVRVEITPTHFIRPYIDIDCWDTLKVGDIVKIHKHTFEIIK